jgi:hypothetical protein
MPVRGRVVAAAELPDAPELAAAPEAVEAVPAGSLLCTGADVDADVEDETLGAEAAGWLV